MAPENRYDPNAPEDQRSAGSQYVSKKDLKRLPIILVVIAVVLVPIYYNIRQEGQRKICRDNLKAIYDGLSQYAEFHDSRLPVAYEQSEPGFVQVVKEPEAPGGEAPLVWASVTSPYLRTDDSFNCPRAQEAEILHTANGRPDSGPLRLTYGMYLPRAGQSIDNIPSAQQAMLLAETANCGALDSYDPEPLTSVEGECYDGFLIGWDESNYDFIGETGEVNVDAVTRLAFYDVADGNFRQAGIQGRHGGYIYGISATGTARKIEPFEAIVEISPNRLDLEDAWGIEALDWNQN
ncbi:MAG: hypothetical protein ACOCX1_03845 [Fimbriimonadaceae bacterium]